MEFFPSPEVMAAVVSALVNVIGLVLYHKGFAPAAPKQHPLLDLVLAKMDARSRAQVEETVDGVLDFLARKDATPPATK